MKILLAAPRGFCAGVNMAIESLRIALETYGPPVYVYHEIVHNQFVVTTYREKGAVFVEDIEEVPEGGLVLYSAHGVSPAIREASHRRHLRAIDATCPLVTKVHREAIKFSRSGYHILLIGHAGHDEVIGTMGEAPQSITLVESVSDVARLRFAENAKLAYLTQTTLSVDDANRIIDELKKKFPQLEGPPKEDICYATQNRQEAVRILAEGADAVIVLGSQNSSNSQRLRELSAERGIPSYLVDGPSGLRSTDFHGDMTVLVTAGASAPESVVQETLQWLLRHFGGTVEDRVIRQEQVYFPLPKELRAVTHSL
jgi:4-hydroxy-3-methylbut-2-enyl diphosphate reductase